MESVILNNPLILLGFLGSLLFCVFGLVRKAKFFVTAVSASLFVVSAAYALLKGASLYEVGTVAAAFFALNLLPLWKKGGR